MGIDGTALADDDAADGCVGFDDATVWVRIHRSKKCPVLLSISQAQPGRTFSQLSDLSFARPCILICVCKYTIRQIVGKWLSEALVYFVCPTTWTSIVTQKSEEGKFFGPARSVRPSPGPDCTEIGCGSVRYDMIHEEAMHQGGRERRLQRCTDAPDRQGRRGEMKEGATGGIALSL